MSQEKPKKQMEVFIPTDLKRGVYSNLAGVSISKREVVIDFVFKSPTEASVVSRVILPIDHARLLEKTLSLLLEKQKESNKK